VGRSVVVFRQLPVAAFFSSLLFFGIGVWPFGIALLMVNNPDRKPTLLRVLLIIVFPAILICSFALGGLEGVAAEDYLFKVKTKTEEFSARYFLPLERFSVLKTTDGRVLLISTGEVEKVEQLK